MHNYKRTCKADNRPLGMSPRVTEVHEEAMMMEATEEEDTGVAGQADTVAEADSEVAVVEVGTEEAEEAEERDGKSSMDRNQTILGVLRAAAFVTVAYGARRWSRLQTGDGTTCRISGHDG